MIQRDAFDSDVLGKRCGIINGHDGGDWGLERLQPWDHVRVAINLTAPPAYAYEDVRRFENLGFHLASLRGTFEGTMIAYGTHYEPARIPTEAEGEGLRAAASTMFLHSRFNTDPFYSASDWEKIHRRWMSRLIHDRCLYVRGPFDAPKSFVGFSRSKQMGENLLEIELIGSLEHKHGNGRHMLASLAFAERCHLMRAKTQLSNLAAVALYNTCGFRLTRTEAILTWSRS